MDKIFLRVQRLEQRRGEAAGRIQSRARWNVRHRSHFQQRPSTPTKRERLDDQDASTRRIQPALHPRILQDQIRREIFVNRDVDVFVNRRRDEEAAELFANTTANSVPPPPSVTCEVVNVR